MNVPREAGTGPEAPHADSLRLALEAPDRVRPGEEVTLTLRVENVSGRPLDLYLRGRTIAFDLVVTDEAGDPVWSRLRGELIPAILRVEHLEPGGHLVLQDSWHLERDSGEPVPSGSYRILGLLLTEGEPLSTPTRTMVVEPREGGEPPP
jgi:hypothetical protein